MRSNFPGHFEYAEDKVKKIWQSATIVLDANVLLNMYRYSDDARQEFLTLLKDTRERCWLPKQCAFEFLNNRVNVIREQVKAYDETSKSIDGLRQAFSGSTRHPFLTKESYSKLEDVVGTIKKELGENRSVQEKRIQDDEIKNAIADVFDGSVGSGFPEEKIDSLLAEATKRFEEKIPPGYKDANKHPEPKSIAEKKSNCGDYIFWREILEMASDRKVPVILVTDDQKEDWWTISSGRTIGPRPELIEEFQTTTSNEILIYRPNAFLKLAQKQLGANVSSETIDEIRREHDARISGSSKSESERYTKTNLRAVLQKDASEHSIKSHFDADDSFIVPGGLVSRLMGIMDPQELSVSSQLESLVQDFIGLQRLKARAEATGNHGILEYYEHFEDKLNERIDEFARRHGLNDEGDSS